MKASEQYFPVVLFITLYKVPLTFESEYETLRCDDSNESCQAVLYYGADCFVVICKKKFGIFCGEKPFVV